MQLNLDRFSGPCSCGQVHQISVKGITIEPDAGKHLDELLKPYQCPVFVCDSNTRKAAQSALGSYFSKYRVVELTGASIHADEKNVGLLSEQLRCEPDVFIAVGSGSIHDLTRYVSFQRQVPFLSFPTAASVDGFVSTVAAMTWYGLKKTFPAQAPIYVLADTNIFSQAPYRLTASGISDLMGKYTALTDWKISHLVTGEYFCPVIAQLEMEAVKDVEQILDRIQNHDQESMEKLMYALLLSGLAMQMIGNSRPASGAEHHMSHLWEMNVINDPIDALHGEKVSVGLLLSLEKYETILRAIEEQHCRVVPHAEFETELLKKTFGKKGLYEGILKENGENLLQFIDLERLRSSLPSIAEELKKLPRAEAMKSALGKAGCKTSMKELHLPGDPAFQSLTLSLSPYVRRRLTLMRLSKLLEL